MTSKAKTKANATAKTNGDVPQGMKPISSSFSPTWDCDKTPILEGSFTPPKSVELRQGNKTVSRRCVEFTTKKNEKYTVWESAGLKVMFDTVEPGTDVYIRFDGLGDAKKGQNPPKLFTVAVDE